MATRLTAPIALIRWRNASTSAFVSIQLVASNSARSSAVGAPFGPVPLPRRLVGGAPGPAGPFLPPGGRTDYEPTGQPNSRWGEVEWRGADHQPGRPVVIVRGKAPKDMKNKEDFWEVIEVVPGAGLMQKPDAFGGNLGAYT